MNIDRMESAIHHIKTLEGQLADYKRELVEAMNEGGMTFSPMPTGVVANGGAVLPPCNPVTGRTRKPRATKPRGGIRLEPAVVASVRQALEAASGPRTTAELVEATELRAPVVIAACREIGARQLGKNRGTRWDLPGRVPPPVEVEDEDPTDEEG